jgi:Arc/MetJ-type ribon-helix-helix transcriptional regulator
MPIHLKPEIEAIIAVDLARGSYRSADEYVERAVEMLHGQEEWLVQNRADIAAKIEEGCASAQRGELLTEEQVRARLERRKSRWIAHQPRA